MNWNGVRSCIQAPGLRDSTASRDPHSKSFERRVSVATFGQFAPSNPALDTISAIIGREPQLSGVSSAEASFGSSVRHSVLGVRQCGTWGFFVSRALPFGAPASVFAFNKNTMVNSCEKS